MARKASGEYVYKPGDHKHLYTWRTCEHCGAEYLGRVDNNSRFCSLKCSGKATGRQPRPAASKPGYLACTKCGEEKPEAAFDLHASSRGGRRARCKACRSVEFQQRNASDGYRARQAELNRTWRSDHRDRANAKTARWRAANRDRDRALARARYRANPEAKKNAEQRRRARKRNAAVLPVTSEMLTLKWNYWAGLCWMCGAVADTWDHVKPLAKGGSHCLANLRPACRSCNCSKHARWPYRP